MQSSAAPSGDGPGSNAQVQASSLKPSLAIGVRGVELRDRFSPAVKVAEPSPHGSGPIDSEAHVHGGERGTSIAGGALCRLGADTVAPLCEAILAQHLDRACSRL
jgi:hypothetical protein